MIYCFVYYLWVGHNYCYAYLAGFTALFLLPGERRRLFRPHLCENTVVTCVTEAGSRLNVYVDADVPRLGSSVAQLPVVPVGWTHPQEVSHLDTRSASGHIQKVGSA